MVGALRARKGKSPERIEAARATNAAPDPYDYSDSHEMISTSVGAFFPCFRLFTPPPFFPLGGWGERAPRLA